MSRLATVFMGTPDIAVPALRVLAAQTDVRCVITQPDRPAGRGHQLQPPPVKVAAQQLGLPEGKDPQGVLEKRLECHV